jgi:hypothetical protein
MGGYSEIERIVNLWGIQMRATRLRNLVLLVYGILHSQSGSMSAIVRHWLFGAKGIRRRTRCCAPTKNYEDTDQCEGAWHAPSSS